ncbi:MAG: NusG domain II-containing protein [Gammaproteobacteria bacterium]|nr:NusG domain II-containing protein [Gammaproteobacteria bacterium]
MLTRTDRWIIACAIIGVLGLYFKYWNVGSAGNSAEVRVNGKVIANLDLRQEGVHDIIGPQGVSTLEVHAHKIRFKSSPCTGKQCIQMGWAQRSGEFLACLPNRVSVTIEGGEALYDAVNF